MTTHCRVFPCISVALLPIPSSISLIYSNWYMLYLEISTYIKHNGTIFMPQWVLTHTRLMHNYAYCMNIIVFICLKIWLTHQWCVSIPSSWYSMAAMCCMSTVHGCYQPVGVCIKYMQTLNLPVGTTLTFLLPLGPWAYPRVHNMH